MNYTKNYQLPQWEETDRVLRTDFNEAMAKTEAGITAVARKIVVADITVQEETSQFVLDLQQVNLEQFYLLELWAPKLQAASECSVSIVLNDIVNSAYYSRPYNSNSDNILPYIVSVTLREKSAGIYVAGLMLTVNLFDAMLCGQAEYNYFYGYNGTYQGTNNKIMWGIHPRYVAKEDLTHLTIQSTAPMQPGSRMILLAYK